MVTTVHSDGRIEKLYLKDVMKSHLIGDTTLPPIDNQFFCRSEQTFEIVVLVVKEMVVFVVAAGGRFLVVFTR